MRKKSKKNLKGKKARSHRSGFNITRSLRRLSAKNQRIRKTSQANALRQRSRKILEEQIALREVFAQINLLDMEELLKKITTSALQLLRVDHIQVRLLEKEGLLRTAALAGKGAERFQNRLLQSGQGRSTWVMKNQKPLTIQDIRKDRRFGPGRLMREMGVRGYLLVPLISRDKESIGVLLATTLKERNFTEEEIALAQQFAVGAAVAIENARLYEETKRHETLQEVLKELSQDVTFLGIDNLIKRLTGKVQELFKVDISDVRIKTREGWKLVGISGADSGLFQGLTGGGRGRTRWVIENRRPLIIPDIAQTEELSGHHRARQAGVRGYLSVPLFSRSGEVMGVLRALTYQPREFAQEEVKLVQQMANGAAIAIENAQLFEEVQEKSQELEQANQEILNAYRSKSDFLNVLAHELRTPLNVVVGSAQLMEDGFYGEVGEKLKTGIAAIQRNSLSLLKLIDEILNLARLEAKRVPVQIEEFSASEIVSELQEFFSPLVREKGLIFKAHVDGTSVTIKSDRSKVKEILQNLLANAVKYTDHGEVELSIFPKEDEESKSRQTLFSVRDTGIGIKEEEIGRVFEPFYMARAVDREKYPGTGLGLSIVKGAVELLGGKISVESEWGKGSNFTVSLPEAFELS